MSRSERLAFTSNVWCSPASWGCPPGVRLLTSEEEQDGVVWSLAPMEALAQRIRGVSEWTAENAATAGLSVGYLGEGRTIEAMLRAGAGAPRPNGVVAIGAAPVPLLPFLGAVQAPTLLLVEPR